MLSKIKKYRHGFIIAIYFVAYLILFGYLEQRPVRAYHVVHTVFDDMIPFCEYFIIPYLLWFPYMLLAVIYFVFFNKNKHEYYQLAFNLMTGMTIFLIICTVFPNGLNLRPEVFTRDNFCIELVKRIYQTDTPTNVLPSLHVYNSICCYIAISHCEKLQHSRLILKGSLVLSILIILSTMFLKQHSVVDVVAACVMAYFLYTLIYAQEGAKSPRLARQVI